MYFSAAAVTPPGVQMLYGTQPGAPLWQTSWPVVGSLTTCRALVTLFFETSFV